MAIFTLKNLSFKYSGAADFTLTDINLSVKQGEFLVIIGESGSGKTTLLRMLKRELTPAGEVKGEIYYSDKELSELTNVQSAFEIGFIMQDPDSQIVTDKVYSELSFGLENAGVSREKIRSKVSEFASYFGLSDKFNSSVKELSGGEKQLLNLASVTVMNPKVIILDEPSSMLDPISALNFFNCLRRINSDLGTTVIVAEHHLGEVFSIADKAVYLKDGKVSAQGTPAQLCSMVRSEKIAYTLPDAARVFNRLNGEGEAPLTIKAGRDFIGNKKLKIYNSVAELNSEPVLRLKDIWFRYGRKSEDILKGVDLTLNRGEIYSVVGANGSGKTTLINIIAQNLKPLRGKVKYSEKLAVLPQNPRDLFVKDRLEDDFKSINNSYKELCDKFGISHLLNRHPYDLSGGELQRAAVVKSVLSGATILLLDEPTKGLDAFMKYELGEFLRQQSNLTILLVTHDLEFAAKFSRRCGMLFDGCIISENETKAFFLGNDFYTTQAVRLTKGIADGAVTVDDIYED